VIIYHFIYRQQSSDFRLTPFEVRPMKDLLAASMSGLCILHCLLTPILLLTGASGALVVLFSSEWLHYALFVPVLVLVLLSLPAGRRLHRQRTPLWLALSGLGLLILSWLVPPALESSATVSGGLLLIGAHLYNRRLCQRHLCARDEQTVTSC
jgi:hypothetical protein